MHLTSIISSHHFSNPKHLQLLGFLSLWLDIWNITLNDQELKTPHIMNLDLAALSHLYPCLRIRQ